MTTVNTVLGPVNVNELGKTLYHEHFIFGYPGFQGDITFGEFDWEAALQVCITQAEKIVASGIKTVVDATPNDCGRNPELLKEVSERTGLQIICTTGYFYEEESALSYIKFRSYLGDVEKEIEEMFRKEINEGIGRTGIKAGVLKVASSTGQITDYEKMFFRAAAKVQKESGVPIITHTQHGTMGYEQAELLLSEGADPGRVAIGHMCSTTNIADHLKVLKTGVYIGIDRFGYERVSGNPPDVLREAMLIGLIGIGYANKILLSQDSTSHILGRPVIWPEVLQKRLANWHPTHIVDDVLPVLKKAGITDEQIDGLLTKNPQHLFGAQD